MKESIDYADIPILGGFTIQGDIEILTGAAAIENALKYFLCAARPDLFDLSKKGVIRRFVNKPLNADTAMDIKIAITSAIQESFTPELNISTLNVIPDYENSEWILQLQARTKNDYLPITLNEVVTSKTKGLY